MWAGGWGKGRGGKEEGQVCTKPSNRFQGSLTAGLIHRQMGQDPLHCEDLILALEHSIKAHCKLFARKQKPSRVSSASESSWRYWIHVDIHRPMSTSHLRRHFTHSFRSIISPCSHSSACVPLLLPCEQACSQSQLEALGRVTAALRVEELSGRLSGRCQGPSVGAPQEEPPWALSVSPIFFASLARLPLLHQPPSSIKPGDRGL